MRFGELWRRSEWVGSGSQFIGSNAGQKYRFGRWATEKISLQTGCAENFSENCLRLCLDALDDDFGVKSIPICGDSDRDCGCLLMRTRADEPHVELDYLGAQKPKGRQRVISGSNIIEGNEPSVLATAINGAQKSARRGSKGSFGQFAHQRAGRSGFIPGGTELLNPTRQHRHSGIEVHKERRTLWSGHGERSSFYGKFKVGELPERFGMSKQLQRIFKLCSKRSSGERFISNDLL